MNHPIKLVRKAPKTPHAQRTTTPSTNPQGDTRPLRYLLTCQSGLESLVSRESERLGATTVKVRDRLVQCDGPDALIYKLLMGSRFANRAYLCLAEAWVGDFDTLFSVCERIEWSKYLTGKERIIIEGATTKSQLTSIPTIQSIAQKAIFSTMNTPNMTNGVEVHILILIIEDTAYILLDVTGDPLHKRGYRTESGEAPIKENLAAALVAFANWKYKNPLLDPFCGSGTIAIEAAMIARNIAPGLARHFRIEELPCYDRTLMAEVKKELMSKIYPSGKYTILARDIDPAMIEIAKRNATRAGVGEDITFQVGDFTADGNMGGKAENGDSIIITNPPYGNRLQSDEIENIYKKLPAVIEAHGGGFITSYPIEKMLQKHSQKQEVRGSKDFSTGVYRRVNDGEKSETNDEIRRFSECFHLANKKLLNGGEECRFWYKKG